MANEITALAQLSADAIDRYAITPAEMLHAGIARRVFSNLGSSARPTRIVHDRVSTAAYAVTRSAMLGAAEMLAGGLRRAAGDQDVRPLSRSRGGRLAVGAINGFAGDRLVASGNDLAVTMAVRCNGADVALDPRTVRGAFPAATPLLAVFLHGLAGTEEWWTRADNRRSRARPSLGATINTELGYTPVYVRYNTGLHISENGASLSALLEALLTSWPVRVDSVALIGHSMGGLVARAACHAATAAGHAWTERVQHVVTLGTPHHGAPLAKAAHIAANRLRAIPETEALAEVLDTRSAGIRDLRYGVLDEQGWRGERAGHNGDSRRPIPMLRGCRYTFITATVTSDAAHPLGWLVGDLLVRTESAQGRCSLQVLSLEPHATVHLGGLHHIDLLDHPLASRAVLFALRGASPTIGPAGA